MRNNEQLYAWEGEIQIPKLAGIHSFFQKAAKENNCDYEVLEDNSNFWFNKLKVQFKGTKENVENLQLDIEFALIFAKIPAELRKEKYNISSVDSKLIEHNQLGTEIKNVVEIQADKRNKIKELSEAIAKELNITCEINENSNGFLKGKTVKVVTSGDTIQVSKFRAIFESIVENSKSKRLKM